MMTFEDARRRLLDRVEAPTPERVPLVRAAGRVLLQPLRAPAAVPPFSYSAMDGYALAECDMQTGAGPWWMRVAGESRTGGTTEPLTAGTACRIFTGAAIPPGADAVVPQESVTPKAAGIEICERPRRGQHIRFAGEDLAMGATALPSGMRLGPAQLALAASVDACELVVARRPSVTILCTGDELRPVGSGGGAPGSIPDALGLSLALMAELTTAQVRLAPLQGDDRAGTLDAVRSALRGTDLLITVGGVSVGDHDLVRPALEAAGVTLDFWKVAIKPGKPIAYGVRPGHQGEPSCLALALPGNPASALLTFALFGMPLLRAMQGDRHPCAVPVVGRLGAPIRHKPGRLEVVRCAVEPNTDVLSVRALPNQASGALTSLAWAEALALVPADCGDLPAGASVPVLRWSDW